MRVGRLMAINFTASACFCRALSITAKARPCFFPNSTVRLPTTVLPATPTTNRTSTSWPRLLFTDSRCRDYSAHATKRFRQRISEPCSTILPISTLTDQHLNLDYQHSIKKWQLDAHTSYDQARLQGPVPEAPVEDPEDAI